MDDVVLRADVRDASVLVGPRPFFVNISCRQRTTCCEDMLRAAGLLIGMLAVLQRCHN